MVNGPDHRFESWDREMDKLNPSVDMAIFILPGQKKKSLWKCSIKKHSRACSQNKGKTLHLPQKNETFTLRHELEIKKREEANQRYSKAVQKIEERYEKDKQNITHSKKEKIKSMVNKSKENPEEVDRILEQELGIKKHETNWTKTKTNHIRRKNQGNLRISCALE